MATFDALQAAIALFEESQRQQRRNAQVLEQLERCVHEYAALTHAIPVTVSAKLNEVLPNAASVAAAQIAANWTDANKHADRATQAYEKAIRLSPLISFGLAALAILIVAGTTTFVVSRYVPDGTTITMLRMEEAELRTKIAVYKKFDSLVQPEECTDTRGRPHICIAINDKIKLNKKGYRAIRNR